MSRTLTYEQPLNERIRSFLRLEFLFQEVAHFLRGASPWHSHATLSGLIEIQDLLGRSDLKTEVLKELERHTANLARLEQNPGVDRDRLAAILDELDSLIDRLHAHTQPLGQELRNNEFLNSLRQRTTIPGGTCGFDLPGYHYWLHQSSEARIKDLADWAGSFDLLQQSIELILRLIRESATARRVSADEGFFQQTLDSSNPCQLLRVSVPAEADYYPEISGGKHRFSIRFWRQAAPQERAVQVRDDIEFWLSCCAI